MEELTKKDSTIEVYLQEKENIVEKLNKCLIIVCINK